ncbi:hypothetical protein WN943_000139 [Citrus x changshan-huyou]
MEFHNEKLVSFYNVGKNNLETEKPLPVYKASAPRIEHEGGIGERNRTTTYRIPKFGKAFSVLVLSCIVCRSFVFLPPISGAQWQFITTAYVSPNSRVFGRGELVMDPKMISQGGIWENSTLVFNNCNPESTTSFINGIFENTLTNNVVSSKFLEKYFYCLWWGLQNLSSYAQSLAISTYIGETLLAVLISILNLVLLAHLIGNMQWLATRGVDEESILHALPTDLRRDIQRHLCLDLVRRVPFFSQMDDQLPDALCERLVSSLSTQGTYIVREGDPVTEMLFIIRERLESSTTNGGRTGFLNSITLRPGDFCGEELLAWALLSKSTVNLPSSTRTVKALIEVEAFVSRAEDLTFVANQFRRLHSKKLQHTFCFYSHHWRTWPACFIQAAWRHCKKRKMAKNLGMMESFSYVPDEQVACETEQEEEEHRTSTSSQAKQNLNVTILASRFAANTRRVGQKIKGVEMPRLQRPDEPDFSAGADDN